VKSGRVIAFTARTLQFGDTATGEKAGPKYLNSPETPLYSKSHTLFNLDKARQAIRSDGGAVLVEGQMDCISVFLAGIPTSSPPAAPLSLKRSRACCAATPPASSLTSIRHGRR